MKFVKTGLTAALLVTFAALPSFAQEVRDESAREELTTPVDPGAVTDSTDDATEALDPSLHDHYGYWYCMAYDYDHMSYSGKGMNRMRARRMAMNMCQRRTESGGCRIQYCRYMNNHHH